MGSGERDREEPIVVCLGYPALTSSRYLERLRAIDPRVEAIVLPVDPGTAWFKATASDPHDEPPTWAQGVAAERLRTLERAEAMIALHIPKNLPALSPRLRWLQGVGAGVEQFVASGLRHGEVVVTNASGLGAPSIAEWVIGRLLQIWKRFPEAGQHQRAHEFVQTYGRTFAGSVIGIVGLGSIGCAVAERARALGLRVLGMKRSHRPGATSNLADELFAPPQLFEMLAKCDAVILSAPATEQTHHMIDAKAIASMRSGAVLVNVARGSLVDEQAVLKALGSGQLSAAVLDVFEQEPLPADSPLWDAPNLFISAHSSVSIDRYIDDVFDLFEENVRRYIAGDELRNAVDMQALGFDAAP